jgi:hypothetical protein
MAKREGRNKATNSQGRGRPPFVPTADQKLFVQAMAGIKMTLDEIRLLIINPQTNEPIAKTVLVKAFKRELTDGKARLKSIIARRFYEALERGDSWAIQLGLRTQFGWRPDGLLPPDPGEGQGPSIRVTFVRPDPRLQDDDPLPRQVGHTPHYDPAPAGQKLLPAPTERPMPNLKRHWMD